jgi:hypothetical protein
MSEIHLFCSERLFCASNVSHVALCLLEHDFSHSHQLPNQEAFKAIQSHWTIRAQELSTKGSVRLLVRRELRCARDVCRSCAALQAWLRRPAPINFAITAECHKYRYTLADASISKCSFGSEVRFHEDCCCIGMLGGTGTHIHV